MMTTNLFVIANVKQLRTDGSFRILLPFFRKSWGVGVLNSAIFNSFHNRVKFGNDFRGPSEFRGGGGESPKPSPGTPLLIPTQSCRTVVFIIIKFYITFEHKFNDILVTGTRSLTYSMEQSPS